MHDLVWSPSEKKAARRLFELALQRELGALMAELKARADAAESPDDLWDIETFLTEARERIELTYDYRYSKLIVVFARLLHAKRIEDHELEGLSEDKRTQIRSLVHIWLK